MSNLMAVKALSGFNYIRADMVIAVTAAESSKCSIYLMGGVTIHCAESAKDIVERLEALSANTAEAKEEPK
jgi:hypothetical protein